MFGIMILVPGIIFFITGFLQYFHSNNALELQTKFSNHFSQRSILNKLLRKTSTELSEKTTFVKAASSLRKTHAKLFTVQAMLLEFLVLVPVIFISLSVGLYINWIIVTVIIGLGAIFVTIFIWKRHQDRNKLEEADVELRKEQANALSQLVNLHSETNIETQQSTLKLDPSPRLESMTRSISSIKHAHQKFKFNSNLTMDTGQSMIVIIFLTLLLSTDVQNMETQYLVILALLFRFIISYGKAIIQVILKLSPFYKFVVDFQKSLGES